MAAELFVVRVRGAGETRYFHLTGEVALELRGLLQQGQLDRPSGTRRVQELVAQREPDRVVRGGAVNLEDADFDMVSNDELREWMSQRLAERKMGAEGALPRTDEPSSPRPGD